MPLGLCLPLSSPQLFGSRRRNYQYTVSRGSRRFSAACSAADRSREQSAGQDDQDEDPLNLHQLTIKRKYEYIQVCRWLADTVEAFFKKDIVIIIKQNANSVDFQLARR